MIKNINRISFKSRITNKEASNGLVLALLKLVIQLKLQYLDFELLQYKTKNRPVLILFSVVPWSDLLRIRNNKPQIER